MRKLACFTISLCIFTGVSTYGQDSLCMPIPDNLIQKAIWLYDYDEAAMLASDSLQAALQVNPDIKTSDFFCIPSGEKWNVYFGAVENDLFTLSMSYCVDQSRNVTAGGQVSHNLFQKYAIAYVAAMKQFSPVKDTLNIVFSSFITLLPDSSFEALFVPAFQPSGQALYGAEFVFRLAGNREKLPAETRYYSGLKGIWIGQPRNIYLNYRNIDTPTLGAVYFAWYYKDFFKKTTIACKQCYWELVKNADGRYQWNHYPNPK